MRPIEFRGKRTDNDQWVYGDLVHVAGGTLCISEPNVCIPRAVRPETVGQYTGREDKTGRRIYEGDRLGSSCPNGIDPLDGSECDKWEMFEIRDQPVRFDSEFLQYRGTPSTEINSILHSRFISVLGTVYDKEDKIEELLECEYCGKKDESVEHTIDPYEQEINNEILWVNVCKDCHAQISEDV